MRAPIIALLLLPVWLGDSRSQGPQPLPTPARVVGRMAVELVRWKAAAAKPAAGVVPASARTARAAAAVTSTLRTRARKVS